MLTDVTDSGCERGLQGAPAGRTELSFPDMREEEMAVCAHVQSEMPVRGLDSHAVRGESVGGRDL